MEQGWLEGMKHLLRHSPAVQLLAAEGSVLALSPEAEALLTTAGDPNGRLLLEIGEPEGLRDGMVFWVTLDGTAWQVTVTDCGGALLLTLTPDAGALPPQAFSSAAAKLRQELAEIMALTPGLAREETAQARSDRTAALNRGLYSLLRLAIALEQAGGEEIRFCPVQLELDQWLESLAENLQGTLRLSGRRLSFRCGPERFRCQADPAMLEVALLNLISNAVKFSEQDSEITLDLRRIGRRLCITVADQGCGIPQEQLGSVFCRSERQGPVADPRWGAGLGLPLTWRIMQAHGGTLLLESAPEKGTQVQLSLSVSGDDRPILRSNVKLPDSTGGRNRILIELADVLPPECYAPPGMEL